MTDEERDARRSARVAELIATIAADEAELLERLARS